MYLGGDEVPGSSCRRGMTAVAGACCLRASRSRKLKRMRFPFPTRIPVLWASIFGVVLLVVQQFQHTNFFFSLLFLAFVMLSVAAFNTAGGFSRPSGGYVFFFATLTCIFGVVWKAVLGEPAETNLQDPVVTMAAYVGSMLCMLGLVSLSVRVLRGRKSFASRMGADRLNMGDAGLGCLACGLAVDAINTFGLLPGGNGSLIQIINHLNLFYPIATILGTLHTIRSTTGRRSIGFVNGVAIATQFYDGTIAFSKQGMFTPLVCWALAAASARLRLTKPRLAVIALVAFAAQHYLVPLSQIGRDLVYEGEPTPERIATAVALLSNPTQLRADYQLTLDTQNNDAANGLKIGYYNTAQGFADRMSMIFVDDQLIAFTNRGHVEGLAPIEFDVINLIPHFILPNKEKMDVGHAMYANHGNYYAHEIGNIPTSDTTTGISFSSTAEAFHLGAWLGVFLLAPLVWGILFLVSDYLYGDPRVSPWALFLLVYFAHSAPEGSLGAIILGLEVANMGLIVIMFFCIQFAPIIGSLLAGNVGRGSIMASPRPMRIGAA